MAIAAPRPPSLRERTKSAAEMAARHVVDEHPKVKRIRSSVERRVQHAVREALRSSR